MTEERKRAICRRFSRAAATYDQYALVQQESAARLAACLPAHFPAAQILEIGCGTGGYTAKLAARFPQAGLTALDFSAAMIEQAYGKCQAYRSVSFLCEDGERFLADNRRQFDLITSNATMQWFDELPRAFIHVARGLAPAGIFHASLFGPLSLHELAAALSEVFGEPVQLPAARFPDEARLRQLLRPCFGRLEISEGVYRRRYVSLRELLRHISRTGTGGHHPAPLLLTRGRLKRLAEWFRRHGGFAVSYQVFFVTAAMSQQGRK